MKKLITSIIALIMTFFTASNQSADRPHVTAVKSPHTAITVQVEQVPEKSETRAETAITGKATEVESAIETKENTPK